MLEMLQGFDVEVWPTLMAMVNYPIPDIKMDDLIGMEDIKLQLVRFYFQSFSIIFITSLNITTNIS